MRGVKDELKDLDSMFLLEDELSDPRFSAVIAASYRSAELLNPSIAELARRRYRDHEHRLTTCREMFISESKYYRMLSFFLLLAKNELNNGS